MKQYQTRQAGRTINPRWAMAAAGFAAIVLLLTLRPDSTLNDANFVPLREHGAAWSCLLRGCSGARESARFLLQDVIGNIAVFMPVGYALAAALTGWSRWRRFLVATALGLLLSLFIETIQFGMATRATDVDDLIFNTVGAALGAGLRRR
jgi:VanZ family protein